MLEAYLVPIEEAAFAFFLVALVLLIPVCVIHYRWFGYVKPARAAVFYSFLFYGLCAVFLVALPLPSITTDFCEIHTLARQMRLVPFQFIPDIIQANQISLRHFNLISILENPVFLQAFFNFLLLMPLGFYLRYYFQVGCRAAGEIALATTFAFELTQITGIYGAYPCPYRTFDVDDLILNASGAMLGYAIMPLFQNCLPNLQAAHRKPVTVSPFRRLVAFGIDWLLANTLARLLAYPFLSQLDAHPLTFDLLIYALWFIGIPLLWRGQTLGKFLVKIRLTRSSGNQVSPTQLCLRYGLLIALPMLTEVSLNAVFNQQLATQEYVGGWGAIALLALLIVEWLLLLMPVLIRADHRGLHDLVAKTRHKIA